VLLAGAEVTTKWLGKEVKKRNETTDEEKKKKVRWGRCALAAEQGSLKMHADRESFTRQFTFEASTPALHAHGPQLTRPTLKTQSSETSLDLLIAQPFVL
jgi:hypothetical protein